jgi:cytoskeletal protein CcmA (bactofilin family)
MVSGNTETNITVTYDDSDNTLDFVATGTVTALNNATENELVTVGSTTTELDAESGLTYDGSVLTVSGEVDATSLDISGDADIDGTLETDALSINGTAVTSTAAELNIMDGGTSATSTTLADADRLVVNDNGTMKQVAMTDFDSDRFSIVTSAPTSGSGKRTGHVWYVV